jgi:hypothetical protein
VVQAKKAGTAGKPVPIEPRVPQSLIKAKALKIRKVLNLLLISRSKQAMEKAELDFVREAAVFGDGKHICENCCFFVYVKDDRL